MKYIQDDNNTYENKKLIRRRFYLSKEALDYFNSLCIQQQVKPSELLDAILLEMANKRRG